VEECPMTIFRDPPIHWAVKNENWVLFCLLYFVLGASITAKNQNGQFVIQYMEGLKKKAKSRMGRSCQKSAIFQILKHLDPLTETDEEKDAVLSLFLESHPRRILKLPKLNKSLIYSAKCPNNEALRLFIDLNYPLDVQDPAEVNKSVLHYLVEQRNEQMLEIILKVRYI